MIGEAVVNYISVKEAADRWCLSTSRVRSMCAAGQIPGVLKPGKAYMIPDSALKPADGRRLRGRDINPLYTKMFAQVDAYRQALEEIRPLRLQEFIRWQEKEMAGFIYNSAALEGNRITSQETRLSAIIERSAEVFMDRWGSAWDVSADRGCPAFLFWRGKGEIHGENSSRNAIYPERISWGAGAR